MVKFSVKKESKCGRFCFKLSWKILIVTILFSFLSEISPGRPYFGAQNVTQKTKVGELP